MEKTFQKVPGDEKTLNRQVSEVLNVSEKYEKYC
jgi:hypothetical protein